MDFWRHKVDIDGTGIISDIISWALTGIFGLGIVILSKKYKTLNKKINNDEMLSEIVDAIHIYPTRSEAITDQTENLIKAKEICFLAYNGFALLDAPFFYDSTLHKIITEWKKAETKKFKVLFLDPNSIEVIKKRRQQLNMTDMKINDEEIKKDQEDIIKNSSIILDAGKNYGNIEIDLGFFTFDLLWCLLFYDNYVLCSFYESGKTAKWAKTYLITRNSLTGKSLYDFFEYLWQRRRDAKEDQKITKYRELLT